jgi:hypothetical protein
MKIERLDSTIETKVGVNEVLSVIENNRTRVRNLCNMILSSCSLFLSSSFVVLFFLIKESYQNNSLIIVLLILSDVMLIIAIFFTVLSAYTREPRVITTEFALISTQAFYYHKEQKNSRFAIIFLFGGIVTFLIIAIFTWS